jgi:Holliday junction resolvase RusA-like endonuclease
VTYLAKRDFNPRNRKVRVDRRALYDLQFGEIPNSLEERLTLLFNCRSPERLKKAVDEALADFKKIKIKKITFVWYTEPHPSKRPRATFRGGYISMYVPMAAETKEDFGKFMKENFPDFKQINTPMTFNVKTYFKTPSSFTRTEKVLAELGVIRPWGRTGDVDNNLKTYYDAAMDTLIGDDATIVDGRSEKFFSLKPRVEYEIMYWDRYPKGYEPKRFQK